MNILNGPRATARAGLAHLLGRSPASPAMAAAPVAETAEEEAEEEQAEGDPQPEAEAAPEAPAAESGGEDDDDDEEMRAAGARAERARISAILNSPAAGANLPAALEIALNTDMPAAQATALLGKLGASKPGLAARMASQPNRPLGDTPGTDGAAAVDPMAAARAQAEANHATVRRLRGETA